MKYLKILIPLFGFLCIFVLNGCDGDNNSSSNVSTTQSTNPQSLNTNTTTPVYDNKSFKVRNDTGEDINKISIAYDNGQTFNVTQFNCARNFCKIKVDEGMVKKGMQFKFLGANDKLLSSYKWPNSINRRFAIGEIKPLKKLSATSIKKLDSTSTVGDSNLCSAGANKVFGNMEAFASAIPGFGSGISALFYFGDELINSGCSEDNIQDSINQLSSRIGNLEKEMSDVNHSIDQINTSINIAAVKDIMRVFMNNMANFQSNYSDEYQEIFTADPNNSSLNMADYVQKNNGGFNYVFSHNVHFKNMITSTKQQLDMFKNLWPIGDQQNLENDLQSMYANPFTIPDDVLNARINGNLIVNFMITNTVVNAVQVKLMLNDEINTILQALQKGDIDTQWLKDNGMEDFYYGQLSGQGDFLHISWADASNWVNGIIQTEVQDVNNELIGNDGLVGATNTAPNMFVPLSGLNPDLSASLIAHKCYFPSIQIASDGKPTMVNQPAILQWYADPNTSGGPYIVTNCFDGQDFVKSVYYTNDGNKVANAIGMLVGNTFLNKSVEAGGITLYNSDRGDGLKLSSFVLNSNSPIKVSSNAVRTFNLNPPYSITYPDVAMAGQYGPVYPIYYEIYNNTYQPLAVIGSNDSYNTALSSLLKATDDSLTKFIANIYNAQMGDGGGYYPSTLNEVVYLSAQKNGNTYVFGLRTQNDSNTSTPFGCPYTCNQHTTLRLVCLSNAGSNTDQSAWTKCKVDPSVPTKIIWNDGTSANLTQTSSGMALSFN